MNYFESEPNRTHYQGESVNKEREFKGEPRVFTLRKWKD
jgi:hypothetical protein